MRNNKEISGYDTEPIIEDVEIVIHNSEGGDVIKNYQTSKFNNGWGVLHKDYALVEQKVIENRIVTYINFNKNKKKNIENNQEDTPEETHSNYNESTPLGFAHDSAKHEDQFYTTPIQYLNHNMQSVYYKNDTPNEKNVDLIVYIYSETGFSPFDPLWYTNSFGDDYGLEIFLTRNGMPIGNLAISQVDQSEIFRPKFRGDSLANGLFPYVSFKHIKTTIPAGKGLAFISDSREIFFDLMFQVIDISGDTELISEIENSCNYANILQDLGWITVNGNYEMSNGPISGSSISKFDINEVDKSIIKNPYNFNLENVSQTDKYGQLPNLQYTGKIAVFGEAAYDIVLRNNTAIQLFSYLASYNQEQHINFFTTLAFYSIMKQEDKSFDNYLFQIFNIIETFNIKPGGFNMSTNNRAINIFNNPIASLSDAKISFLANIAHILVDGTWGFILEFIQIKAIQPGLLDLSEPETIKNLIDAWSNDIEEKNFIPTKGLVTDASPSLYGKLFYSCYESLIMNVTDDMYAHAVDANIYHPFDSENASIKLPTSYQQGTSSFSISEGSISYYLKIYLEERKEDWSTPDVLSSYFSNAMNSDLNLEGEEVIGGTIALWEKIRNDYYSLELNDFSREELKVQYPNHSENALDELMLWKEIQHRSLGIYNRIVETQENEEIVEINNDSHENQQEDIQESNNYSNEDLEQIKNITLTSSGDNNVKVMSIFNGSVNTDGGQITINVNDKSSV